MSIIISVNGNPDRMVKEDLPILFPDIPVSDVVIVMDGSTAHTEKNVTDYMTKTFKLWIGNNSPEIQWPRLFFMGYHLIQNLFRLLFSRSPDLQVCDFAIFHPLRCRIFSNPPRTLKQLKCSFLDQAFALKLTFLQKCITQGFLNRLAECKINNGKHLEIWRD